MRVSDDFIIMDLPARIPLRFQPLSCVPSQSPQTHRKQSLNEEMEAVQFLCEMINGGGGGATHPMSDEEEEKVVGFMDEAWDEEELQRSEEERRCAKRAREPPEVVVVSASVKKKPLGQHSSWKTKILREWFLEHADTDQGPYPTQREKDALMELTGLTVKQLDTWFSNSRRSDRGMWTSEARALHKKRKMKMKNT